MPGDRIRATDVLRELLPEYGQAPIGQRQLHQRILDGLVRASRDRPGGPFWVERADLPAIAKILGMAKSVTAGETMTKPAERLRRSSWPDTEQSRRNEAGAGLGVGEADQQVRMPAEKIPARSGARPRAAMTATAA